MNNKGVRPREGRTFDATRQELKALMGVLFALGGVGAIVGAFMSKEVARLGYCSTKLPAFRRKTWRRLMFLRR